MIVGLGNPGKTYQHTRHNIGFMLVDLLVQQCLAENQQVTWKERSGALFAEVKLSGVEGKPQGVIVLKPMQFMNESGRSVGEFAQFYKMGVEELIVAHDEVDIPFGSLRIKRGGGDGGHKGVRSIATRLGSPEFARLRLGIGRPVVKPEAMQGSAEAAQRAEEGISNWVLGKFAGEEDQALRQLLERGVLAVKELCQFGLKIAQNRYN